MNIEQCIEMQCNSMQCIAGLMHCNSQCTATNNAIQWTRVSQPAAALQPGCEEMEREWGNEEEMEREWGNGERMRKWREKEEKSKFKNKANCWNLLFYGWNKSSEWSIAKLKSRRNNFLSLCLKLYKPPLPKYDEPTFFPEYRAATITPAHPRHPQPPTHPTQSSC